MKDVNSNQVFPNSTQTTAFQSLDSTYQVTTGVGDFDVSINLQGYREIVMVDKKVQKWFVSDDPTASSIYEKQTSYTYDITWDINSQNTKINESVVDAQ